MTRSRAKNERDRSLPLLPTDPRYYQIAVLALLLLYGVLWLDFDIGWLQIFVSLGVALLTQYACTQLFGLPSFDPRSPLISGLSLCLLLRGNSFFLIFLTAVITIASKFAFKCHRKHIFNPTNFGLVAMMLFTDQAWVSPAQWGSKAIVAFFLACLGGIVIYRAARSDVSYAFLFTYAAILFGRAFWLGDPWAIPLKQLQNGALLLFTFFMISDPKTTPDSRVGRILFAILVAAGAAYVQFVLYRTNGLLWSLALCSLLTPAIDRLLPGTKYEWSRLKSSLPLKGESHEKNTLLPRPLTQPSHSGPTGAELLWILRRQG